VPCGAERELIEFSFSPTRFFLALSDFAVLYFDLFSVDMEVSERATTRERSLLVCWLMCELVCASESERVSGVVIECRG
jgi:hypothetical protein